jgi:hypothetical protein
MDAPQSGHFFISLDPQFGQNFSLSRMDANPHFGQTANISFMGKYMFISKQTSKHTIGKTLQNRPAILC